MYGGFFAFSLVPEKKGMVIKMNDFLIMFFMGLSVLIIGLLLLKREAKLFNDSVITTAKVNTYYDYTNRDDNDVVIMYTMEVEYSLPNGTLIHAREQSGSNRKKYPVGAEIKISYSTLKTDLFIVCGDHSRKAIMVGMVVVGLILMALSGYARSNI